MLAHRLCTDYQYFFSSMVFGKHFLLKSFFVVQFKLAPPNWLHNGKPDTPCLALIQLLCTPSLQTAFTYWQLCEIVGISSSQWRTCDWINSFWFEDWNCDIFKVRFGVSLDNVGWRWIIWWQDKRELSIPAELKKNLDPPIFRMIS